jgi:hypothetical protein
MNWRLLLSAWSSPAQFSPALLTPVLIANAPPAIAIATPPMISFRVRPDIVFRRYCLIVRSLDSVAAVNYAARSGQGSGSNLKHP